MIFQQRKLCILATYTTLFLLFFPLLSRAKPPALTTHLNLLLSGKVQLTLLKRSSPINIMDLLFLHNSSPVIFEDQLWFTPPDQEHGMELWRTDGTKKGTELAADINPGPLSSTPSTPVIFNNALYFFASDSNNGRELHRIAFDTGTGKYKDTMVKDIYPGADDAVDFESQSPVILNGRLVFVADDGIHGEELWMSDGTEQGTKRVSDINPGSAGARPKYLTVLQKPGTLGGNILLFSAYNNTQGSALHRLSKLTPWGSYSTALVNDFTPADSSGGYISPLSHNSGFTLYNEELYFIADAPAHGSELWKTDGYASGTTMVKEFQQGPIDGITESNTLVFDHELYFSGVDDNPGLWKTDGTATGTVKAFNNFDQDYVPVFIFNNALYFTGLHISGNGYTYSLWKRSWDDAILNWKTMPLGNTIPLSALSYTTGNPFFYTSYADVNGKLYFAGASVDNITTPDFWNSASDFWTYSLDDRDRVEQIKRPLGVTIDSPSPGNGTLNLIEYHGALYFTAVIDEEVHFYRLDPKK